VLFIFLLGGLVTRALQGGASIEEVTRTWLEAKDSSDPVLMATRYEFVIQNGMAKPELQYQFDDAMVQLHAIHAFDQAFKQPDPNSRRAQLVEFMIHNPNARITAVALTKYNELVESQATARQPSKKGGFSDEPSFMIDRAHIHMITENLEQQLVAVKDLGDLAKERELKAGIIAGHLRLADGAATDVACLELQAVLTHADPNTPVAIDTEKRLRELRGIR
jgi:hypothetical protein